MRILAIGSLYPPHHLGGYELVWSSAMRHLRDRGHEAWVLCTDFRAQTDEPDDPDTLRELRWYWRDHRWPRLGWRARIALERHNASVLDRCLSQLRPDVVCWWAMGGMSMGLLERVRRAGIPAVAFVHDDWLLYGPRVDRWIMRFRRRPVLARLAERATGLPASVDFEHAARYVFVSETVRQRARDEGLALGDSAVAHSGIESSFLNPREAHPWRWRLLYVGRLDERKGVLDAVAALAELPRDATLTIAGAGDERLALRMRQLARRLAVADRIRELGMRSRTELPDAYGDCDVVLFPVRWQEPWGLVPLESMAIGRPVIATGLGGSGEYLRDGENCLLVAPGDPVALARAVRRLSREPELASRLRAGGLRTAATHTEAVFNDAVVVALEQAVRLASVAR